MDTRTLDRQTDRGGDAQPMLMAQGLKRYFRSAAASSTAGWPT